MVASARSRAGGDRTWRRTQAPAEMASSAAARDPTHGVSRDLLDLGVEAGGGQAPHRVLAGADERSAPVEPASAHLLGPDPAADTVARLDDGDGHARPTETAGGGQPAYPAPTTQTSTSVLTTPARTPLRRWR